MVEIDLVYIAIPIVISAASLFTTILIFRENAEKTERKETVDLATKVSEKLSELDKRISRLEWESGKQNKDAIKRR